MINLLFGMKYEEQNIKNDHSTEFNLLYTLNICFHQDYINSFIKNLVLGAGRIFILLNWYFPGFM